ncbi:MAG: hypothetical protein U1E62_06960 [Alsobacter sp.]
MTDWGVAAVAWKDQLAALYVADTARRLCGVSVAKPVRVSLLTTIRGLEQALGVSERARAASEKGVVAQAGGRKAFCGNAASMAQARQTLAAVQARAEAAGNMTTPSAPAQPVTTVNRSMPTPVVDPDIALIRGCRSAAVARTSSKRVDSGRFWTQYERCVADQGAGWY